MAPCSDRRRQPSRHDQEDIVSKTMALLSAALMCAVPESTALLRAQQPRPDFTGVYYPINPFGMWSRTRVDATAAAENRDGALPPPRPVLVLDGREGRPDNAPKLTPEYLARWEVIRKSRMAGSPDTIQTSAVSPAACPT